MSAGAFRSSPWSSLPRRFSVDFHKLLATGIAPDVEFERTAPVVVYGKQG